MVEAFIAFDSNKSHLSISTVILVSIFFFYIFFSRTTEATIRGFYVHIHDGWRCVWLSRLTFECDIFFASQHDICIFRAITWLCVYIWLSKRNSHHLWSFDVRYLCVARCFFFYSLFLLLSFNRTCELISNFWPWFFFYSSLPLQLRAHSDTVLLCLAQFHRSFIAISATPPIFFGHIFSQQIG